LGSKKAKGEKKATEKIPKKKRATQDPSRLYLRACSASSQAQATALLSTTTSAISWMGHLPSILFTFFLLHSSGAIAVGGDRLEGEQAFAVRTQEKRETEKKRERERERAWQVVHTPY
jgi:hypothetical protein